MDQSESLGEYTKSYLRSIISEISKTAVGDAHSATPFQELGLDSFLILKVVKRLEEDFGTLPKTLLFENFNIEDLSIYFTKKFPQVLAAKLPEMTASGYSLPKPASPAKPEKPAKPENLLYPAGSARRAEHPRPAEVPNRQSKEPIRILEKDAMAHPEIAPIVSRIYQSHKHEGSVSRGTRNIAPNLFLGGERRGYFNYSRSRNIILVYAYTGPEDYFPAIAEEMHRYCLEKGFELNFFAAKEVLSVGGVPFSATPFGVVQRIVKLKGFSLGGNKMRRLRYQISRFENAGKCATREYRCGTDPEVDRSIAIIIEKWCESRTMVNPLIHAVKEEILAGRLGQEHRIFLTFLNDVLQNAILITSMGGAENGYLMDLEFYPADMPAGGLDYAIGKMIEILVAEGCDMLSLGGTYGCKLAATSHADPEVDRILDTLRVQNIFNDEGNLQFKNKFRPENLTVFLCRPVTGSNPDNVTDIIMMIADPGRMQTSEAEHQFASGPEPEARAGSEGLRPGARILPMEAEAAPVKSVIAMDGEQGEAMIRGEKRFALLSGADFNPMNIPDESVEAELKTDSWAQLRWPAIEAHMAGLQARLQQPADLQESLEGIFPFKHFVLTTSGRSAEHAFYKALERKGVTLQNLLFPTTIFHLIDNGFEPRELPCPAAFELDQEGIHKGNLDWEAFEKQVSAIPGAIALVCLEVNNNAAGGQPVSLQQLKKVKVLLSRHSIPLILDATRIVENARHEMAHDPELAKRPTWDVVREILSCADAVVASLAKDFCVNQGGLIATHDPILAGRIQALASEEGIGLDVIGRKVVALALRNRVLIEHKVMQRMESVRKIRDVLAARGVPLARPVGGHCVLVDVKRMPEFNGLEQPVASFLAWLYLNAGIRAGAHSAGMQKHTALNGTVRIAIPVGLGPEDIEDIAGRLALVFDRIENIPDVRLQGSASEAFADPHAKYALNRLHKASGVIARGAPEPVSQDGESALAGPEFSPAGPAGRRTRPMEIAVVGMAGRYPKAENLFEMWANLVEGRDCIETLPEDRLEKRLRNAFTEKYRGGFLERVDAFDAPFFNITPREAEIMDPQERLFLEVAWEALEDAGYYPEILPQEDGAAKVGVFVGAVWTMYQLIGAEEKIAGSNVNPNSFLWSIANRVSYWMNFSGPSLALDTACSSSLTALHLACESIRRGECTAALVGGVNLDLHQSKFDINSMGGTLSKDGVCRTFGKGADGYVGGEGVGALVLKPLDQAVSDGDNIHGVIKGVAMNHGGRTGGYMKPNPHSQAKLVRKALAEAGVDARSIGFIEAHGTATELGDAIEVSALSHAFQDLNVDKQSCPIGSVKTNIGHLEAASGVVGVQKVLLQMKHGRLVPSLHSAELNALIDFDDSPFYVGRKSEAWERKVVDGAVLPLRAGISAFGAGGTNTHAILEHYEHAAPEPESAGSGTGELCVFPLSARNEEQLLEAARRLRDFVRRDLSKEPSARTRLRDISHTLRMGRKPFDFRMAVIAGSGEALLQGLDLFEQGKREAGVLSGHVKNAEGLARMLNPKEKASVLDLLCRSGDLPRQTQLWCDGAIPDWRGIRFSASGKKVSLPTYPFAKHRYWIGRVKVADRPHFPAAPPVPAESAAYQAIAGPGASDPSPAVRTGRFAITWMQNGDAPAALDPKWSVADKARLFVRQMLADQLKSNPEDVDIDHRLLDTGITSMDMAQMTHRIKADFGPAFSPTAFFECATLRDFADRLGGTFEAVFQKMIVTDTLSQGRAAARTDPWDESPVARAVADGSPRGLFHVQDAESDLALPDLTHVPAGYTGELRNILLTGATGFLGIHILAELSQAHPEATLFCLVRAKDREIGLRRVLNQAEKFEVAIDASRIRILCGDVTRPLLGLGREDWDSCCSGIQHIIHASAHVNHIEGYATFRDSTQGMKEILRLASTAQVKLIHFISSIAGCTLKIGERFSIYEKEAFLEEGAHVFGGYGQSKWVQETFLKRAHEGGIPFAIYRFGELSGSSRTGLGQTDDMMHRLLQMRMAIGCREKISSDVLDMLPVDTAAKVIVYAARSPHLWNRIFHATHPKPCPISGFYRRAQEEGLGFEPATRQSYLSQCQDYARYVSSLNPVHGFVLECILRDAEGSSKNLRAMDGYFGVLFPFDQGNFTRLLGDAGLSLHDWKPLLDLYFQRWSREECGFMARIFEYRKWSQAGERQLFQAEPKTPPVIRIQAILSEKIRPGGRKYAPAKVLTESPNEQ